MACIAFTKEKLYFCHWNNEICIILLCSLSDLLEMYEIFLLYFFRVTETLLYFLFSTNIFFTNNNKYYTKIIITKQNLTLNVHIHVVQYNLSITYKKFTVCYLQLWVKALSYIDMWHLQRLLILIVIICFYWTLLESLGEHKFCRNTPNGSCPKHFSFFQIFTCISTA